MTLLTNRSQTFSIFRCALLISGTCIGGGMLALPLSIASFGFMPAVLVMFLSCIFMSLTALLYLEATLWMGPTAHMNTLSSKLLTPFWKRLCLLIYLLICFLSVIAYISGGGKEIAFTLNYFTQHTLPEEQGAVLFAFFFGLCLVLGYRFLGKVNSLLFMAMIMAYVLLIGGGASSIQWAYLDRTSWSLKLLSTTPLMLTIFSFPGIVPSITNQLEHKAKNIRLAIFIGTILTLFIYAIWVFFVIGSVPFEGKLGLKEACFCEHPITQCICQVVQHSFVAMTAQFFAFFALATSFLGISLSLFDFFFDTFNIQKKTLTINTLIALLVIVPSLVCAIVWKEHIFLTALEVSGGVGDAFLSGMIPVMMVWRGRYKLGLTTSPQVFGGKATLLFLFLVGLGILCIELVHLF